MTAIKTVAVIGAGNIGAYVIRGFADVLGENLWVIADGERKERLERDGLIINGKRYALHVRTPEEAHGANLVVVSVKYNGLREILPDVRTIAAPHTLVMSLLNGVDSEEILSEAVPASQIMPAMIELFSARQGNEIIMKPTAPDMGIHFGTVQGGPSAEAVQAVCDAFDMSSMDWTCEEDVLAAIWTKYASNNSSNLPQVPLDAGAGAFEDSTHVKWMRQVVWEETRLVAEAEGIHIPQAPPFATSEECPPQMIFSTLQDYRAGRKTEVEMFAGKLIEIAARHGLQVPVTETLYHIICALEEKSAGLFDYGE